MFMYGERFPGPKTKSRIEVLCSLIIVTTATATIKVVRSVAQTSTWNGLKSFSNGEKVSPGGMIMTKGTEKYVSELVINFDRR